MDFWKIYALYSLAIEQNKVNEDGNYNLVVMSSLEGIPLQTHLLG